MITDDEQGQKCHLRTRKIRDPLYTTFQKIFTIIRIFLKSEAPKAPGLFTFVHRGGLDKYVILKDYKGGCKRIIKGYRFLKA